MISIFPELSQVSLLGPCSPVMWSSQYPLTVKPRFKRPSCVFLLLRNEAASKASKKKKKKCFCVGQSKVAQCIGGQPAGLASSVWQETCKDGRLCMCRGSEAGPVVLDFSFYPVFSVWDWLEQFSFLLYLTFPAIDLTVFCSDFPYSVMSSVAYLLFLALASPYLVSCSICGLRCCAKCNLI